MYMELPKQVTKDCSGFYISGCSRHFWIEIYLIISTWSCFFLWSRLFLLGCFLLLFLFLFTGLLWSFFFLLLLWRRLLKWGKIYVSLYMVMMRVCLTGHQINPLLPKPPQNALSRWFLNLLSNQAKAAKLAAWAWFERRFKNPWHLTRVSRTHFHDTLKTTINIFNRLADFDLKFFL